MIKKLTAVLLCVTTLIALCSIPTSAGVWHDEGLDMLRSQWQEGEGPSVLGFNIDYSYYVPETDNPCPLMIFMGGAGNGTYEGKELEATSFPYWSSVEYQAMAENADGMYLMILRSPLPFYFDTCPLIPMFEAIRDFVDTHNVDKKRICLFGRCLGASGVNRLANAYPDYFSGACYMCPRTIISASDARAMKNMKVWILCSMLDSYSIFPFYTLPSWINEILFTKDRTNIRLTSCLTAPRGGGFLNHEVYWLMDENFSASILNSYTASSRLTETERIYRYQKSTQSNSLLPAIIHPRLNRPNPTTPTIRITPITRMCPIIRTFRIIPITRTTLIIQTFRIIPIRLLLPTFRQHLLNPKIRAKPRSLSIRIKRI